MSVWVLVLMLSGNGSVAIPGYKNLRDCEVAFLTATEQAIVPQIKDQPWLLSHICVPGPTP